MKRNISKSDIKRFDELLLKEFGVSTLSKKDVVQIVSVPKSKENEKSCFYEYILVNNKPSFFFYKERIFPSLKFLLDKKLDFSIKKVVVDMGSVKYLCGGADIMRPGIVYIDSSIKKDDFIVAIDEKNNVPLIIGLAMYDFETMNSMQSGKVIINVHYVSDYLWNL